MKKLTSLGIDLSTAATGLVLLEENGKKPNVLLDMEIKGQDSGISRNAMIVAEVMQVILAQGPSKIVIEGYSLSMKNASSVIPPAFSPRERVSQTSWRFRRRVR